METMLEIDNGMRARFGGTRYEIRLAHFPSPFPLPLQPPRLTSYKRERKRVGEGEATENRMTVSLASQGRRRRGGAFLSILFISFLSIPFGLSRRGLVHFSCCRFFFFFSLSSTKLVRVPRAKGFNSSAVPAACRGGGGSSLFHVLSSPLHARSLGPSFYPSSGHANLVSNLGSFPPAL